MGIIKISVGMPVYNGEPYLEQAIRATLDQTFEDFELIISDNASSDRTEEICRDFASQDSRIIYIRNDKNIGAANNYNQLFHKSSGEYFRWFNADDLCSNKLHELCLIALEGNPLAIMSYGKTDIIDESGNLIEHYEDNLNLLQDSAKERFLYYLKKPGLTNAIYGLIRRSVLENTKLMGNGSYPAADISLIAELSLYGRIVEVPETLFSRRMHVKASSWNRSDDGTQQQFWIGSDTKFLMPTFKREFSFINSIMNSPILGRDKLFLYKYIIRRIIWWRKQILKESLDFFKSGIANN
jgi:glycosyltransferase involved in cell wall biosynthesis